MPPRRKTVATLLLLTSALPFTATLTAVALVRARLAPGSRAVAPDPKTILISGGKMTKALALARAFHRAGHRVVLVESAKYRLSGHRFSRSVSRFDTVPTPGADGYAEALLEIVRREQVDLYVPVCSPAASRHDAAAKRVLSAECEVLHVDEDTARTLDDKYAFSRLAASLGLAVPDHHRITSPREVIDFDFGHAGRRPPYILKSIAYDPVRRLDLTQLPCATRGETAAFVESLPISEANPWVMQEFVSGQEYCTHSTARDGQVQLHCCCESSAFQLNYEMVEMPEIESWVRRFVGALKLTGQLSFDFIRAQDGRIYAIECNPRAHSAITMFYDHPDVARAYLESGVAELTPLSASRPTYWLYHELWRMMSRPSATAQTVRRIARGKDAIFDWSDPLPFLMVHHAQIPSLLLDNLRHGKDWNRIDFNIGKLVEPAGD